MWVTLENNLRYKPDDIPHFKGLNIHVAYCRNESIATKVAETLNNSQVKLTEEEITHVD